MSYNSHLTASYPQGPQMYVPYGVDVNMGPAAAGNQAIAPLASGPVYYTTQAAEMNPNSLTPNEGLTVTDPGRVLAQPPTDGPSSTSSFRKRKASEAQNSKGPEPRKKKRAKASPVWLHFYGVADNGDVSKELGKKPSERVYPTLKCRHCGWVTPNGPGRTDDLSTHVKKDTAKNDPAGATNAQSVKKSAPRASARRLKTVKGKNIENRPEDSAWKTKFQVLLTKWLENDREASNTLVRNDFKELMLHAGQGQLTEEDLDIPSGLLFALKKDLANSFSKIFFTYDSWRAGTFFNRSGFVAVSAHWSTEESGDPTIRSRLVAIEYLQPGGDPEETFFEAIDKLSLSPQKIGVILWPGESEWEEPRDGVQLCQHPSLLLPIEAGFNVPCRDSITLKDAGSMHEPNKTSTTLCDIFKRCRTLLKALPLFHDNEYLLSLAKSIVKFEFSWRHWWHGSLCIIQALLKMRQDLSTLCEKRPDLEQYCLSASEWSLLVDIEAYLDILRRFNTEIDVATCEATSRFLIAWKSLGRQLRAFQERNSYLKPIIKQFDGLGYHDDFAIEETYNIHNAMVLNPTIKFTFVTELYMDNDPPYDIEKQKEGLVDLMLEHCCNVDTQDCQLDDTDEQCRHHVERELDDYLDAGIVQYNKRFDLLKFWKSSKSKYPHLYRTTLDILPAPIERISCKRVFSTSEHTKALLDGTITLKQFEMLERHKYASGKAHLQDVVWRNFEDEDKVKGCLPGDRMLKSLVLAVGGEYDEDSTDSE